MTRLSVKELGTDTGNGEDRRFFAAGFLPVYRAGGGAASLKNRRSDGRI